MNSIPPYFGSTVTHADLTRFGVDNTPILETASADGSHKSRVEASLFSSAIPEITCAFEPDDVVRVRRRRLKDNCIYVSQVLVDRQTGLILHSDANFRHIARFDPNSITDKDSFFLEDVHYWTVCHQYV